jgi:hypothetical protein
MLGTPVTQVAHLLALPARRQIGLGALALEDGAAAHIAGNDVVDRPQLLLHEADDRARL